MKLHNIRLKVRERSKQRIGRGGKRGSYSGRGVKGQKSRAGRKLRPAQRDLILRLPKLRGFRNKAKSDRPIVFNLQDVQSAIKSNSKSPTVINKNFFVELGLVPPGYRGEIKILSQGDIDTAITFEKIYLSKKAKEKVEKAGGAIDQKSHIKEKKL